MGRATLLVDPGFRDRRRAACASPISAFPPRSDQCTPPYALEDSWRLRGRSRPATWPNFSPLALAAALSAHPCEDNQYRELKRSKRREESEDQGPEIRLVAEGVKTP